MSRFVRSSSPAKRVRAHPLCKSPLYFQQLTNCFFAKSFSLIFMQTAPGGGGVSVGLAKRALFVGVNTKSPRSSCSTSVRSKLPSILYLESYCRLAPSRIHSYFNQEDSSLTGSERRNTQRFQMRLPLTVRWTTGAAVGETSTESRDVSSRGVYFFLSKDVKEGSAIEILLTLPNEITLAGPVRVRCLGRVQRTEPRDEGAIGVVAAIERYEFLRAADNSK
jgi:hypothetical protein